MTLDTLLSTLASLDTGLGDSANKAIVNAIMLVIVAFPLAFTPILMKVMGGIAGQIGGMVNNRSKGFFDRTRNLGRGLSRAQSGAIKGAGKEYLQQKRGEWASHAKPGEGRFRSYARQVATTGKIAPTKRNKIATGAMGEKYEDEEVKLAKAMYVQRGVHRNKDILKKEASNAKNGDLTRFAAAQLLAEEGGVEQMRNLYEQGDEKQRTIAAKAMAASPNMGKQGNIYSTRAQEYLDAKDRGVSDAAAKTLAEEKGNSKVQNKATAEYVISQKVTDTSFQDMEKVLGKERLRQLLTEAQKNANTKKNFSAGHQKALDALGGPAPDQQGQNAA